MALLEPHKGAPCSLRVGASEQCRGEAQSVIQGEGTLLMESLLNNSGGTVMNGGPGQNVSEVGSK